MFNRSRRHSLAVLLLGLVLAISAFSNSVVLNAADSATAPDIGRALEMFRSGQYDETISLANVAEQDAFQFDESWAVLRIRAQLTIGKYEDAGKSLNLALEKFPNSIRVRWIGAEVCRQLNESKRARTLLNEIDNLWAESSWRFRDVENQIVLGKYFQSRRRDAKQILKDYFNKAKIRNSLFADTYLAIGDLALSKHDYQLAAENYTTAIKHDASNPDAHLGLARSFRESDFEKAAASLNKALELNPNHIPSLLVRIDQQINAESYDDAEKTIDSVLDINPHQPAAWAYRAVIAHLNNDHAREGECRGNALKYWQANPGVDHLIGKKLSQKYRFKEGATYQRRAIVYDPFFVPAKIQLAHDLLRLGQELEGWKLADEVFDEDQYSVVALNLVNLRDHISKFATLESDGFVVRMDRGEAEIYGSYVLELLRNASKQLSEKYQVELETPIFIEIFPEQQDFAIRTFGLPGGEGFLGVCFGRVVTMNSPAAQGASLTNWKSVLWHEFCHVVTLQKTRNRMPRWLSEGISVYEERLANSAWGQSMNPGYRQMILDGELTPVSKLSSAFLKPKSAQHLNFAYFESSLVVQYIVEKHGLEALQKVLRDLGIGIPIADALRRYVEPKDVLDAQFEKYAKQMAAELAPKADWTEPELLPSASAAEWAEWNKAHPGNVTGLLRQAAALSKDLQFEEAVKLANQAIGLYSDRDGIQPAYQLLASIYRQQGDDQKELVALKKLSDLDASSVETNKRLLELTSAAGDWRSVGRYASRLIGINPLLKTPHRYLAMGAEKVENDDVLIPALRALSRMDPIDPADIHFRLASAHYRREDLKNARRHVLLALDAAPRYRDAHQLLLKINNDLQAPPAAAAGGSDDQ